MSSFGASAKPTLIKQRQQVTILSVEGGVAVGKTALLTALKTSTLGEHYCIYVFEEPISDWQNVGNSNLLQLYYEDPLQYAFAFQQHCLRTRFDMCRQQLRNTVVPKDDRPVLILMERSWHSDMECFITLHHRYGHISEVHFDLLKREFSRGVDEMPLIDGVLLLQVPFPNSQKRIQQRGRQGETNAQPEYYKDIVDVHRAWMERCSVPFLELDGTKLDSPVGVNTIVFQVDRFIQNLNMPIKPKGSRARVIPIEPRKIPGPRRRSASFSSRNKPFGVEKLVRSLGSTAASSCPEENFGRELMERMAAKNSLSDSESDGVSDEGNYVEDDHFQDCNFEDNVEEEEEIFPMSPVQISTFPSHPLQNDEETNQETDEDFGPFSPLPPPQPFFHAPPEPFVVERREEEDCTIQ